MGGNPNFPKVNLHGGAFAAIHPFPFGFGGRSKDTPLEYSEGFKARMVQRLTGPDRTSASKLARELGLSQPTLSGWLRDAANEEKREKKMRENPQTKPGRPNDLPPAEKLRLVMEASALPDGELGAFLRRHGLHETQIEEWRRAALAALQSPRKDRPRKSPEAKRVVELERELYRKDKALAEVTALLALKKKLDLLFGDADDDTTRRSGS